MLLGLFLLHPFITMWYPSIQIKWELYIPFITLLAIIFISPNIERIKAKELEIELYSPPQPDFVLSPAIMEVKIEKLETHPKR